MSALDNNSSRDEKSRDDKQERKEMNNKLSAHFVESKGPYPEAILHPRDHEDDQVQETPMPVA